MVIKVRREDTHHCRDAEKVESAGLGDWLGARRQDDGAWMSPGSLAWLTCGCEEGAVIENAEGSVLGR